MIIVLIIFVILSGFFSASETAYSSASEIRLKAMEQEGNKAAARALRIIEDYDALLSTILIGNNIVNIGASSIATVLFVRALGDMGATWSTIVMTVIILIFSEVTPKSIAKEMPERFAMAVGPIMKVLMTLFYPFNKLFGWWKALIAKVLGVQSTDEVTEGEFLTMVEEAESGGGIEKEDTELIHSVLEFNDIEVADIFTPRVDVVAVPLRARPEELEEVFREHEFSRIPVYDEDIDDIVGILHQRDYYEEIVKREKRLQDVIKPVLFVPPGMKISRVLELLQQKHNHMAVVSDEFGGTDGVITMEDILEELVGEIYDEHDDVEKDIVKTGRDSYIVRCSTELPDMFEYFGKEVPESESNTVAGWVLELFGEIPKQDDEITYENLLISVLKTDNRRVEQVRVRVMPSERTDNREE
ncbi:MAG: HlyC/CorC family transporter [Clostridia bacterium]|nr:HlyC/CorC family transporter [Clostridia bacterium]